MAIPCQAFLIEIEDVSTMGDECNPVGWRLAPSEVQGYS